MARMSNKRRLEWSFFLNDRSRITYNELCRKCQHARTVQKRSAYG